MARYFAATALALLVLVIVVSLSALGYRAFRQNEYARAMAITTPDGVAASGYVQIGGIPQWIQVRGEHRSNPVLLILAGGPGDSLVPMTAVFRPWEKYFTVVQWDQRGAGKTFEANGAAEDPMTIERYTQDAIEVAEFLRKHLKKDRIFILGDSWGTVIGVRMAKLRPDLLYAYVGTGQVVDQNHRERYLYDTLLKKVRAAKDADSLATLKRIGPPPYRTPEDLYAERMVSQRYDTEVEQSLVQKLVPVVLFAPNYSLWDLYAFQRSEGFAVRKMYLSILGYDARKLGPDFSIPFFIFNGDQDHTTPMELSKPYFDEIRAPKKEYVVLEGGGHRAILSMSDRFLRELVARVRPLAMPANATGK